MSLGVVLSRHISAHPLNSFDAVSGVLLGAAATVIVYKTAVARRSTKKKMFIFLGIFYIGYRLWKLLRKQYRSYKIRSSTFQPRIVIIGAGMSGVCMAIKLKHELGYDNFIIYEILSDLGGTWYANTYPGCCCDVPGDLYSYSFAPNPNAERAYPTQPETLEYIKEVARKYDIYKHIEFNSQVIGAKYDDTCAKWTIEIKSLQNKNTDIIKSVETNFVISCTGLLVIPKYPNIANFNSFGGKIIHSAQWDHEYDFSDKRVAVIGTGCSAIQVVPTLMISEREEYNIKQMDVYQRTPGHIFPKEDYIHSSLRKWFYNYIPFTLLLKRYFLYWRGDMLLFPALYKDTPQNQQFQELANRYRMQMIPNDPQLREKVSPQFPFGAKRILVENSFYAALQVENVNLIANNLDSFTFGGIKLRTGECKEYDCIILCTGYETEEFLKSLPNGIHNIHRKMEMKKDIFEITNAKAYIGRSVAHFPNWFQVMGPGSGLGHSSMILIIENDTNYIKQIIEKFLISNAKYKSIEVKENIMNEFVAKMDKQMMKMVWTDPNTKSWYKNKHDRVAALFGWSTVYHWWISRKVKWNHFILK